MCVLFLKCLIDDHKIHTRILIWKYKKKSYWMKSPKKLSTKNIYKMKNSLVQQHIKWMLIICCGWWGNNFFMWEFNVWLWFKGTVGNRFWNWQNYEYIFGGYKFWSGWKLLKGRKRSWKKFQAHTPMSWIQFIMDL